MYFKNDPVSSDPEAIERHRWPFDPAYGLAFGKWGGLQASKTVEDPVASTEREGIKLALRALAETYGELSWISCPFGGYRS